MVKFNPRDKGNKPGIAIMIAVKKPNKGEKLKKNDEAAYYSQEVPALLDLRQHGVGPAKMEQHSQNINEMANIEQDRMLDNTLSGQRVQRDIGLMTSRPRARPSGVGEKKYRSMSLPFGMSQEDNRAYQKRLEATMPKKPAPGKDFMSRLRSKEGNTGTVMIGSVPIKTGEPMDLAWRLLKYDAGMDGLDSDGNYPENPQNVPQFAFKNDSAPTDGFEKKKTPKLETWPLTPHRAFPEKRFNKPPNTKWGQLRRDAKPPTTEEERLANLGFSPQNIDAANQANDASRAAMNNDRRLFQPKGG